MPPDRLAEPGRRRLLRRDDVEPTPVEQRHEHFLDAAVSEAAARGDFEALPGRGRPLPLSDGDARQDPMWLTNHLLKNAGFVPSFAEAGRLLEAAQAASAEAEAAWRAAAEPAEREARARALEAAWERENRLVLTWNREAPSPTLQKYALPPERRWARLRPPDHGREAGAATAPP